MGAPIRTIKRRINFLHNIKKITKAMQMVSVSKLRLAQLKMGHAVTYMDKLGQNVERLAHADPAHPMLVARPVQKVGYLVVTSDRGLCGGYNSNLLRFLIQELASRHTDPSEYQLFVLGQKGISYLSRRKLEFTPLDFTLDDLPLFTTTQLVAEIIAAMYTDQQLDGVYLCYNKFINVVSQQPVIEQVLPFSLPKTLEGDHPAEGVNLTERQEHMQYEDEPNSRVLLGELLPSYFAGIIYNTIISARTSEFASKMTAMSNATDTTVEMIDKLIVRYNRTRQAIITQEIAEIVGGTSRANA